MTISSPWKDIKPALADPILGLVTAFKADNFPQKVSLAQGAFRTEEGKPLVLNCVRKAEAIVANSRLLDKEYNEVEGNASFRDLSARFAFGEESSVLEKRVCSVQALSGTGALRVAAATLRDIAGYKRVYLPMPSWGNHAKIFAAAGLDVDSYCYLDKAGTGLDIDGMLHSLKTEVPDNSVILLHAAAHNPTGVDPSEKQWRDIAKVCAAKSHVCLFDSAYQGFATGDAERDAYAVRYFEKTGHYVVVCQSFAKNMGLYGERVGAMHIVTRSPEEAEALLSNVKAKVVRPMYSSPPLHGARLAALLLGDADLRSEWAQELRSIVAKIASVRGLLAKQLTEAGATPPGTNTSWDYIAAQIGMFAYTGLSSNQVQRLRDEYHIYMTLDGRLSLAGLATADVPYVVRGVHAVLG